MALLSVAQSPLADDPGGLNSLQVTQDRRQARQRNVDVDAGERLDQVTTGLRYRRRSGELHETTVAAWYGHRDFRNRLPITAEGVTGTLDQIEKTYGDKVRIVFKHLPLAMHSRAPMAHAASEAANRQGKFWEMHDLIFANQRELSEAKYMEYAQKIGLDVDRFKKDLASASVKARVDADAAEARKLGVTGTPGFFVNGYFLSGAKPFSEFKRVIDAQLAKS